MASDTTRLTFEIKPSSHPVPDAERDAAMDSLGFGTLFTDHMAVVRWSEQKGWHGAEVTARAPFAVDPASSVLHYAQEIFEGLKAYRTDDGRAVLFRPEENARRFNQSAHRMAMPELPEETFLEAIDTLVALDAKWIPSGDGSSLYLRPFMFANEVFLGVRPSREHIFCVIASPVGPYFKGGLKPLKLWVSENYARAGNGGTGAAKCGGNYAASLLAHEEAVSKGCDQVVFLDAATHTWVEELGGMNIFFVKDGNTLVTPPLSGTILPGITRKSLIELAHDEGFAVEERPYSFADWKADAESGALREAFACGTAAVVAGIGTIVHRDGTFKIADGGTGEVTTRLRDKLIAVQRGKSNDVHGWVRTIAGA